MTVSVLVYCALFFPSSHPSIPPSSFPPSPALRSPMSVPPGSYPAHFGVVSHAGLNGELASPGGFGGALTLSPQISAAASAYSRSPMVCRPNLSSLSRSDLLFRCKLLTFVALFKNLMNHFCAINCIRYILEAVTFTFSNSLSYSATVIEKRNFTTKSLALMDCIYVTYQETWVNKKELKESSQSLM